MPKLDYQRQPVPRGWNHRRAVVAVGAAELLVAVLLYAGPSWHVVLYQLLSDGALLILWLAAAAGWGSLLRIPFAKPDPEGTPGVLRLVTCAALGLGGMSLATLGLGLGGWLNRGTAWATVGAGLVAAGAMTWRSGALPRDDAGKPLREWLGAPAGWDWLWLAVLPLLAIALVGACVPPGMLWHPDEPHGYDVVEYHFQIPREWYEAGRIEPLRHNVFSYFPFNVEMHYLLAMHLRGGPWKGMYLAQLMHVAYVALSVLGVYGVARALVRDATAHHAGNPSSSRTAEGPHAPDPREPHGARAPIAALAASVPWLVLLAPVGYNEGGLLLYGGLAVGWVLRALDAAPRAAPGRFALAGAMAGFACGVKLTAVPLLLLGLPVATILVAPKLWRAALVLIVVGTAAFAPWAARNLAWTGNPVFPEAASLLGRGHFSEVQVERWDRAHSPRPDQQSIGARLAAGGKEIVGNWRFGFVSLPLTLLALAAAATGRWNRAAVLLAAVLLLLLVFWLALTHLQGRFFVIAIPITALFIATISSGRWWPPAVAAVLVVSVLASWGMVHAEFTSRLHGAGWVGVIGAQDLSGLNPPGVADVPPDATLVLVGDARAFWYQRPMRTLRYITVFDVDLSGNQTIVEAWSGGSRTPGGWLLIDPEELRRFHRTYHGIPALPAELEGQKQQVLVPPK